MFKGHKDKSETDLDPMTKWTAAVAVYTNRLVWVGGLSALISIATLWAIHGQLDEMRQQRALTIAQLRATLRSERPQMTPYGEGGKFISPGELMFGWNVNPILTNVGGTDARDFVFWWDILITPAPKLNNPNDIKCPSWNTVVKSNPGILPRDKPSQLFAKQLSLDDVKKVSADNQSVLIFIRSHVDYRDIFPDTPVHHYDVCMLVLPNDIPKGIFSFPFISETSD